MPRTKGTFYEDSRGILHEVRVTPAVARALDGTGRANAASDRRWKRYGHSLDAAQVAAACPWEGRRIVVRHFVGHDRQWPIPTLPDGRCGVCRGLALPRDSYCLACDRSGLDGFLATAFGPVARPRQQPNGLAGGLGPVKKRKATK